MVGGKDHTTHHLVYSGLNDRQVWRVFLSIGLISIGFVLLSFWSFGQMTYVGYVLGVGWFVFIFYYLYRNTIRFKNPAE
jgi:UDP-GlcNAc:undecaprenyl-phosphate GlcNAc-1-phosphate transferase